MNTKNNPYICSKGTARLIAIFWSFFLFFGLTIAVGCSGSGGTKAIEISEEDPGGTSPGDQTQEPSPTAEVPTNAPNPFYAALSVSTVKVGDTVSCNGETVASGSEASEISYSYSWEFSTDKNKWFPYADVSLSQLNPDSLTVEQADELTDQQRKSLEDRVQKLVEDNRVTTRTIEIKPNLAHRWLRCYIDASLPSDLITRSELSAPSAVTNSDLSIVSVAINKKLAYVGDQIECEGIVEDPDQDGIQTSIDWRFVKINELGAEEVIAKDGAAGPLDIDSKLIGTTGYCRLKADDGHGSVDARHSATVVNIKNRLPSEFQANINADGLTAGSLVRCVGVTEDPDHPIDLAEVIAGNLVDPNLSYEITWYVSSGGQKTPLANPTSTPRELVISNQLRNQDLSCQITARDLNDGIRHSQESDTIRPTNQPPRPFYSIALKTQGFVGDEVSCQGETTDPEGDDLIYSYRWQSSSTDQFGTVEDVSAEPQLTLTSAHSHKFLRCYTTATDTLGAKTQSFSSSTLVVLNALPSDLSATISTDGAIELGSVLSCSGEAVDADDDGLAYSYSWFKSNSRLYGYSQLDGTEQTQLVALDDFHQYFKCRITVNDGHGGTVKSLFSEIAVVKNSDPEDFSTEVNPAVLSFGLSASCTGETTDSDNDQIDYTTKFYFYESSEGGDAVYEILADSVTIHSAYSHKYISCEKIADDGFGGVVSSGVSELREVINTPPENFVVTLSGDARVGNMISCDGSTSDLDADAMVYEIRWYIGDAGSEPELFSSSSRFYSLTHEDAHRRVYCSIIASDGHGGQTLSSSSLQVTVENWKPDDFTAALANKIAQNEIVVGETLACSGDTIDRDGDSIIYTYEFEASERAGLEFSPKSESGPAELLIDSSLNNHLIRCRVSATDSTGSLTESSWSPAVLIPNQQPDSVEAELSKYSVVIGETLECIATVNDPDGDDLQRSFRWYFKPNGALAQDLPALVEQQTASTLYVASQLFHGQLWCDVTVSDGLSEPVVSELSPPATILNTVPIIGGVSISPSQPSVFDTLVCSGDAEDIDLDVLSKTYKFYQLGEGNEKSLVETNSSGQYLPGPSFAHSNFSCSLSVDDGFGGQAAAESSGATSFQNSAPETFAASISAEASPPTLVGANLSCSGQTTDADGDGVTYLTKFVFSADGQLPYVDLTDWSEVENYIVTSAAAHGFVACLRKATDSGLLETVSIRSTSTIYIENSKPVISGFSEDLVTLESVTSTFTVNVFDADGDEVSLDCLDCGQEGAIEKVGENWILSLTPSYDNASRSLPETTKALTLTVSDPRQSSSILVTEYVIGNTDRPPEIVISSCNDYTEEESAFVGYSLVDPDGDDVEPVYISGFPVGPSLNSSEKKYFIPASYDYVSHSGSSPWSRDLSVELSARYSDGSTPAGMQSATCNMTITDVNRPPELVLDCGYYGEQNENETQRIKYITRSDPDGDSISSGVVSGSDWANAYYNSSSKYFHYYGNYSLVQHSGSAPWYRNLNVTIYLRENHSGNTVNQSCSYRANDVNRAPYAYNVYNYICSWTDIRDGRCTMSAYSDRSRRCTEHGWPGASWNDPDLSSNGSPEGTETTGESCRGSSGYWSWYSFYYYYYNYNYYYLNYGTVTQYRRYRVKREGQWSSYAYQYKVGCFNYIGTTSGTPSSSFLWKNICE